MTACPSLNVTDANKLCLVSNACQAFLKMLQAMLDCCSRVSKLCLNNNCFSNQSVLNIYLLVNGANKSVFSLFRDTFDIKEMMKHCNLNWNCLCDIVDITHNEDKCWSSVLNPLHCVQALQSLASYVIFLKSPLNHESESRWPGLRFSIRHRYV